MTAGKALWLLVMLSSSSAAFAELYKWVDEKGKIHYTESPPPAGSKALEIKKQVPERPAAPGAPPAAHAPARTPPAAAAAPAAAKPAAAKAQPAMAQPQPVQRAPAAQLPPEAARLVGKWSNAPSEKVHVRLAFQNASGSLLVSQLWKVGGNSAMASPMQYAASGAEGKGTLEALDSPYGAQVPLKLRYEIKGEMLTVTVPSGLHAGSYRLLRADE